MKNERCYELDTLPQGQERNELKQYYKIKDSLLLHVEQTIILKNNRIVILRCFEINIVKLAHVGHQGLVKSKFLLTSKGLFSVHGEDGSRTISLLYLVSQECSRYLL